MQSPVQSPDHPHFYPANYKCVDSHNPLLGFHNLLEQLTELKKAFMITGFL